MGWASSGFEIGNILDRRAYPAPRLKRMGPPPSIGAEGTIPGEPRGTPIRARPFAFHLRELGGRALVASPHYVGPGLIKRLDIAAFQTNNFNPQPHVNVFYNTTPYVTASNLTAGTLPAGTRVLESDIADDQGFASTQEGGIDTIGNSTFAQTFLLDVYVAEADFYVGVAFRNDGATQGHCIGTLLVYEGVQPSDFPYILG